MKSPPLFVLGLAALAAVDQPTARSQDAPAPPPPARVRVDVQMVSIPVAEAGRLIPAFQNRQTANEAWNRLQTMITNAEATLIGWPVAWAMNGERAVFESLTEDRYPTEPMPPNAPHSGFASARWTGPTWGPHTPSAFETRNTGATLEAEATVRQDGKVISLNLVSQYMRRIATREWHTQTDPLGIAGVQQQPEFLTSKVTVFLDVRRDQPYLIGTFVVAEPQPHVELFILRARATLLPPNAFPPPFAK